MFGQPPAIRQSGIQKGIAQPGDPNHGFDPSALQQYYQKMFPSAHPDDIARFSQQKMTSSAPPPNTPANSSMPGLAPLPRNNAQF